APRSAPQSRGRSWSPASPLGTTRTCSRSSRSPGSVSSGSSPPCCSRRSRHRGTFRLRSLRPLIALETLTDGGQSALDIAHKVAGFIEPSARTLELALYDVRLQDDTADVVHGALVGAHERGVDVRLVYNVDRPDRVPVPPPPKTEPGLVESLPFATVGIKGWPDLMH